MQPLRSLIIMGICAALGTATMMSSCKKTTDAAIQGCMDPSAINYNPQANSATTCHYNNERLAGTYEVHDTVISFYHNFTQGWLDTTYHSYTLVICAPKKDSLTFTPEIGRTLNFSDDCTHFNYYYDNCPPLFSTIGHFSGDTLYYYYSVRPIPMGNASVVDEWFVAVKKK